MTGNVAPLQTGVQIQIPYHFRCPISLELMRDPVTVSTGQTYDRASIETWMAAGNTTCPVTREPLSDFSLIPNHTLRRLIQDWCVAHRSHGVERIPTPKQPADPSLLRSLLSQASSSSLRCLRNLARDCDKNRSAISTPDARSALLALVFTNGDLADDALALLAMLLPLSEPECASVASNPDHLAHLSSSLLCRHPNIHVRVDAAAVLESVSSAGPHLRALVGGADGIFEGLVRLLDDPLGHPRALKVGIKAMFSLCLANQNRHKAVAAGAAEALMARVAELEKCDVERALATVELLCRVPAGCAAFAAHALTVPVLVKIILKVSDRATEYAAGALLSLCSVSELLQREAVAAGVVTQLLLLVQSDCTDRAKRKAQLLLKLLHTAWPQHNVSNSDDFGGSELFPF